MEKETLQDSKNTTPQAPSVTPETSQIPKPPKRKTGLIIGLSLFLLLLAITGIFAYQNYQLKKQVVQTPPTSEPTISPSPAVDQTANWKTYTSEVNGFSFKYPLDWQMEENVNYIGPTYPNYTFFFKKKVEFMPGIKLFVVPKTTPEEWVGTRNSDFKKFAKIEEFALDDVQATKISGIPGALEQEWIFVDKTNKTIIFYAGGLGDELTIFDQILSTFKLLDQTGSTEQNKFEIPEKGISFVISGDLIVYKPEIGYELMLFRTEQQKQSFLDCMQERIGGECNLYSLAIRIKILDNPDNLSLEDFVAANVNVKNTGLNPTALQKLKIGNYNVIYRDSEGMGLVREMYIAGSNKIYSFFGNSFKDTDLDLLNELIKGLDFL